MEHQNPVSETLHGPVRAACNVPLGFVHLLTITFWCQALSVCVCACVCIRCRPALNTLTQVSFCFFLLLFFLKNSQHIYILQLWHFFLIFLNNMLIFFFPSIGSQTLASSLSCQETQQAAVMPLRALRECLRV